MREYFLRDAAQHQPARPLRPCDAMKTTSHFFLRAAATIPS